MREIDIIIGCGGIGLSYTIQWFANNGIIKYINMKELREDIKHVYSPEELERVKKKYNLKINKIIYLFGDLFFAVHSHWRRGLPGGNWYWAYDAVRKNGNPHKLSTNRDDKIYHDFNYFLDHIEKEDKDLSGCYNVFRNWYDNKDKISVPIMFIDFYDIKNRGEEINKFLGRKLNFSSFQYKKRPKIPVDRVKYSKSVKMFEDLYQDMLCKAYSKIKK